MCGRYSLTLKEKKGTTALSAVDGYEQLDAHYNIAPSQSVAALLQDDPQQLQPLRWGTPFYNKEKKTASRLWINARVESLEGSTYMAKRLAQARCLILADGYYEWRPGADSVKQPYHMHLPAYELFAFCGFWVYGRENAEHSVLILTQPAAGPLQAIHHRMPVVIKNEAAYAWLAGETMLDEVVKRAHDLVESGVWVHERVGLAVNRAGYDKPDCVEPEIVL